MLRKIVVMLAMVCMCFGNAYASYPYESVCPDGGDLTSEGHYSILQKPDPYDPNTWYWSDKWAFAQCNCTSFAAYVLNDYGISFNNSYRQPSGQAWHHGKDWNDAALRAGITVDNFPIPGDIVYWENMGSYGHVAEVVTVDYSSSTSWNKVFIKQYNGNGNHEYSEKWIYPSDNPSGFIHILAYEEGIDSLHYLNCYEMDNICDNQTHEEWNWIANKVWNDYRCTNCVSTYNPNKIAVVSEAFAGMGGGSADSEPGSKPDITPDFDILHQDGHEISANCDNCPTENVNPNQVITMRLEAQVNNRDVEESDLFNSNSQSIDGEVFCRVRGITDWQEIPGSEDVMEFDVDNLVTDNNTSLETLNYTVPNYPGEILDCKANVDSDNEVNEQSENNNNSRVESFFINNPQSQPTPEFAWNSSGPISEMECIQILETADPDTWDDNYFCSKEYEGISWSSAGPIQGMRCTQITEGAEPSNHTWNDNYLCVTNESNLNFYWSSAGPISNKNCVQWLETSDPDTWDDNYLCWNRDYQVPNQFPEGWLDEVSCNQIRGWVRDPNTTSPIDVHFYADGEAGIGTFIGKTTANQIRPDLPFNDKNHGFVFGVPEILKDGHQHTIYAYGIDDREEYNPLLNGSLLLLEECYIFSNNNDNSNTEGNSDISIPLDFQIN